MACLKFFKVIVSDCWLQHCKYIFNFKTKPWNNHCSKTVYHSITPSQLNFRGIKLYHLVIVNQFHLLWFKWSWCYEDAKSSDSEPYTTAPYSASLSFLTDLSFVSHHHDHHYHHHQNDEPVISVFHFDFEPLHGLMVLVSIGSCYCHFVLNNLYNVLQ